MVTFSTFGRCGSNHAATTWPDSWMATRRRRSFLRLGASSFLRGFFFDIAASYQRSVSNVPVADTRVKSRNTIFSVVFVRDFSADMKEKPVLEGLTRRRSPA